MEIKCPYCREDFIVNNYENLKQRLFTINCPFCKDTIAVKPGGTVCRIIPVLPDLTREIQPIDYERQLTSFDYELALVAKIKL